MKKIIIFGGSGFVGKSLKEYLKKKKNNKIKIVSYSRSENKNIIKIKKLPKTEFIIYCINNKNIKKSLRYYNHLKKLLEKSTKKIKIMFFSSGAVYGPIFKKKRLRENQKINLSKVKSFNGYKKNYAIEKIILEKKFKEIANLGFKVSIVRGFTFYGKYILKYNYLISQILRAVQEKKKLKIKNKYTYRSFMHADDMCEGLIKILEKSSTKCPIYNLGSGYETDIVKLVKFLNKKYGSNIMFDNKINPIDYYIPSTFKMSKVLNTKKFINLNRGIELLLR